MRSRLTRLARMRRPELQFRVANLVRVTTERWAHRIAAPRWHRRDLAPALTDTAEVAPVLRALRGGRPLDAHHELASRLGRSLRPFPIHPAERASRAAAIRARFPAAADAAAAEAQPLLAGRRRLLGFPGLDFGRPPDWHFDPVHNRRSPMMFWADVPYLDPRVGDHKIIWELNRHQHWLVLGRAAWLTGDRRYRDLVLAELEHWLRANPPLTGINWASMLELALRCLSWTWAAHFFADDGSGDSEPWLVDLLLGLDRQLTHVEHNLSYYFSPNTHLSGEALGLFVCGHAFPELAASARRISLGRTVLLDAIQTQIAADGGHRERSTHYHRYTLDFYLLALTVARLADDPAVPAFTEAVERLAVAAQLLADDTARIPHIGDDDGGALFPICGRDPDVVDDALAAAAALTGRAQLAAGPPPEEVFWLLGGPALRPSINALSDSLRARRASLGSGSLPATGYFVMRSPDGEHLVVNAGPHGYLNGGHAHADALAVTLSLSGQPLLVDTGTGAYTADPVVRDRLRSTAAHNTLVLDDRPQSEPAGPFHWRRVADARATRSLNRDRFDYFEGVHSGYAPAAHHRHILTLHGDLVIVADYIESGTSHRVDIHWHIHPAWQVSIHPAIVHLASGGRHIQIASTLEAIDSLVGDSGSGLGWHSPAYGRLEPLTTLRCRSRLQAPAWACTVFGLDRDNPVTAIEPANVSGAIAPGVHCRIRRALGDDHVVFMAPTDPESGLRWRTDTVESDARVLFHRAGDHARSERLIVIQGTTVNVSGDHGLRVQCAQHEPGLEILRAAGDHAFRPSPQALDVSGATAPVQVAAGNRPLNIDGHIRLPLAGVR